VPVSCEVFSPIVERWTDVRLFPSGDGLAAFYLDVHQRKQTELALRESEASLTAAQARAQIGSWEIDHSTRIVKWSAEMFRIFGRDSKLGPPRFSEIAQMVHPDDRESFGRGKSATNEQEFRVVRPDGDIRWIEGRGGVVLDEAGQVLRHIGTAQDVTERTQVQLALRASEARYHSTLDSILEACQLVGHDWTYLYLNDAAATHNRRPNAELFGRKMTEVWPGIESTGLFALLRRCMDERIPLHDEVEFTFPDGSKGWFDVRTQPVPEGIFVLSINISARRHAEESLVKAGALQRAIFDSTNFSSIATDARGVIQIFNVGAERMLGYTADEVMNRITPADISDPQEVIARAAALSVELETPIAPGFEALVFKASRGIEDIYELTYIRKDGSRFPAVVSVTALRDANEIIIGYLLIGTDNTARKQIEEERTKLDQRLRDQHFYTRSLIESNIDALMTTDPRGIIIDVNKQTEALTGCTRDELIGAPFRNCFTDSGRAEAGINRVLNEGKVTNYELTARARNGQLTVVSYNATTFHDRDRRLQGVVVAARDVTELKRFEETLLRNNLELKEASRMKSEFLANMSHELRTPLNSIIGFSEVLKDGLMGAITDQQRESIGNIFSSGNHLLSLINDILDLSKIEAGKMTLDLQSVHWHPLFANSLSVIHEMAASRRIRLDMAPGSDLGSTRADPRKVKQILYNLLSNAVKFTEAGGRVTMRAVIVPRVNAGMLSGSRSGRTHPLPHNEFAEFLEVSVTDSGGGISAEGLERLFKPFSQIDGGLARKFEGTGLGLAMVKLLTELHGGTVGVESTVGEGSRFIAWLPIRVAGDATPVEETPVEASLAQRSGRRLGG
jgi:PAS domain S-box-containing protein